MNIDRLALYEPPFIVDDSGHVPPADLAARLDAAVATGRRGDVVKLYMTRAMGIAPAIVTMMRVSPFWSKLKATAFSTRYDLAVMGDMMAGKPPSAAAWAAVTMPTLVMAGEKSPALLRDGAHAIAGVLADAEHRVLPRLSHNVNMRVLAPELEAFFAARRAAAGDRVGRAAGGRVTAAIDPATGVGLTALTGSVPRR